MRERFVCARPPFGRRQNRVAAGRQACRPLFRRCRIRRTLYRRTRFVWKRNRVAPERRRSLFRLYRCLRQFGRNFLPYPLNGAACLNRRPDFSGGFLCRFCFGRRLVPAVFGWGGLFFVLFRVYSIGSGSMPTLNLLRFLQGCYPMIKLHRLHQWHPTLPA